LAKSKGKPMLEIFLTFAAFILAYFAFIDRIIKFRLNASILTSRRLLWVLATLGSIALADMLINNGQGKEENIIKSIMDFFDLSMDILFREVLEKIFNFFIATGKIILFLWNTSLVAIILYLFYKLTTPLKFTSKNAKVYFNECNLIIANGIETEIQKLTVEISVSISTIFHHALQNSDEQTQQYAAGLIILFSDEIFCKKIVNHNPSTLHIIFETVANNCSNQCSSPQ
jgi:hypothetical protein